MFRGYIPWGMGVSAAVGDWRTFFRGCTITDIEVAIPIAENSATISGYFNRFEGRCGGYSAWVLILELHAACRDTKRALRVAQRDT